MLRTIIDLVLLAIILLSIWRGYRNGLIAGLLAACAVLFSFFAADVLSETYSQEFTNMLEPFVSGVVDSSATEAETYFQNQGVNPSVYDMSLKSLGKIGIMKTAAENIARQLETEVTETGHVLRAAMVDKLCSIAAYVLCYVIMFVLLIIAFGVIGNLINLAFKLPGLELVNTIMGILFGLAKGLMYAFAIAWVLRFTGLLIPEETVDQTILLKKLMEICPLTRYLGL